MTLTKRIIPCLDVANGRVVKGLHFESIKDAGDPVLLAEKYSNEGADELVFLDITASTEQRETIKSLVAKVADVIDIPFTVGGGVKSLQHARDILLNGADKVAINTGAVKNPTIITELMELFGKQCIVVAIDAKRNYNVENGKNIFSENNKEFLMTNVTKDGTLEGPDIDNLIQVCKIDNINVISRGGVSNLNDVKNIKKCNPYGVILGKALYENLISIEEAKKIN